VKCPLFQDTPCVQQWIATLDAVGVCNLQGEFGLTDRVICRDVSPSDIEEGQPGASCNVTGDGSGDPTPALLSVQIGRTSICEGETIDTSEHMRYSLKSYFDRNFHEAQDVFQTGDMIYFAFEVTNPAITIDEITFNQIIISGGADATLVTDTLYWVPEARSRGTNLGSIDFDIFEEVRRPVPAGTPGRLTFGFRLLRTKLQAVSSFLTEGSSDPQPLTIQIVADLLYHGNQKRSVQLSQEVTGATLSEIHVITVMENPAGDLVENGNNDVDADDVSGAVVNSIFSSLVLVILACFTQFLL